MYITGFGLICRQLASLSVIPWGLEPQSKEPESFILSIELRNQLWCKDNKKNKRESVFPFIFLIC